VWLGQRSTTENGTGELIMETKEEKQAVQQKYYEDAGCKA